MKLVGVFGSTGSIGENTLRIIEHHASRFRVHTLAGGRKFDKLAAQVRKFRPKTVVLGDAQDIAAFKSELGADAAGVTILGGPEGLEEAARAKDMDIVISAVTGAQGLPVSLGAIAAGKRLGLANKESMVMAGPVLNAMAHETGAEIVPVDSEHSALFQCLLTGRRDDVQKLILTASGGPFRQTPKEEFPRLTVEQALKHPTWSMGPKITIDSASMMNKALEIVEARWLFDIERARLDVVVHPQSIVHSMVLWKDGSVVAQLGAPDMRIPIQYAMTYPDRIDGSVKTYSPEIFNGLNFFAPDYEKFPSLTMGYMAAEREGTYGAVLNAANEKAVERFFAKEISFQDIFDKVWRVMDDHRPVKNPSLNDILAADAWAREELSR